jgi:TolB-like protein/DNA-binding winged helix-turn-helix (wHTH) protein/Tfp pilus assembly protein PilF
MKTVSRSRRVVRSGAIEADLEAGELRKGGNRVPLQEQPFQVLAMLVRRPGKVVTREEILEKLWPADCLIDRDRSLDIAINTLRQALGDPAENPRYLETIAGRGYRFIGERDRKRLVRRVSITLTVIFSVVMLMLVAGPKKRILSILAPTPPADRIKLAVLPFTNLSGKVDDEVYADGMTEEMIARMGRLQPGRLGVIAATSVMPYKKNRRGIREIGKELGVDYILEGSVLHEGNQIRIYANLIQVSDETHLWSNRYDRPSADLMEIESEVAANIARALTLELLPAERARLASGHPASPEAHEAYLKGRYHWNKRTPDDFQKAIAYFQQAIRIEPNYALAYAGLADTYNTLGFYSILPPDQSFLKSKQAAERALQIDDTLAEAHASLADALYHYNYDWAGAEKEFRRAVELNPNSTTALHWYSIFLALHGRAREGQQEIERALDLDPLSPIFNTDLALHLFYDRQYDQAIEQCKKVLGFAPNFGLAHFWMARAYAAKAMYPEAITEFQRSLTLQPNNLLVQALLGNVYAVSGQRTKAEEILEKLKNPPPGTYVSPDYVAVVYVGLADKSRAMAWAERAYREHAPVLTRIKVDPVLDSLRSDPRFQDLVRRVGPPE